ncbi:MAG: lipid-A-disaccharide synthase [Ignavibacteriae bacterium]|nr:lipid-A-disaccharide synthase [Ignavibacteriota bacterium]
MKKIFISAGDPSGDAHGARLMAELKLMSPDIEFIGIGGNAMCREGLNPLVSLEQVSVVGFWEVAKKYFFFRNLIKNCARILKNEKFDAFIPIDYPGFNIRLASFAKQMGIPVIYYIAPQLWAWGEGRAKKLADVTDLLLAVFPFEKDFFNKFGIRTEFVGHPLLDNPDFINNPGNADKNKNLIAFLPGSRKQEIVKHMPLFNSIAQILKNENSELEFGLSVSFTISKSEYESYLNKFKDWQLWDDSKSLMNKAYAGIVKTGTSTLEAALCNMPFAMVLKTSPISYRLGKRLVKLDNISLVNILAGKKVVNEYIQSDAKPETIANEILSLFNNGKRYDEILNEFSGIRKLLGEKGASKHAAELIIKELNW